MVKTQIHQSDQGVVSYHNYSNIQTVHFEMLISRIAIQKGWNVLDLGCGTGNLSVKIAEMVGPNGKVIGVDPMKERIDFANKKYGAGFENLEFHQAYGKEISKFGDNFDMVIASQVVHWMSKEEKLLTFKAIYKCLKSGGYFLFTTPSENPRFNLSGFLLMLPVEMSKKLQDNYFPETSAEYERMLNESGFLENSIENKETVIPFSYLEDSLIWFASTFHDVDFQEILECLMNAAKTNDISFMFNAEGRVIYSAGVLFVSTRKTGSM